MILLNDLNDVKSEIYYTWREVVSDINQSIDQIYFWLPEEQSHLAADQ